LIKILSGFGSTGIIGFVLWYVLYKMIPAQNVVIKEMGDNHSKAVKEQTDSMREIAERFESKIIQLDTNHRAERNALMQVVTEYLNEHVVVRGQVAKQEQPR
jgi:hypothetical protein